MGRIGDYIMNEFWHITIWDGDKEIDHLFIEYREENDPALDIVIEYMLWLTYCEKRWDFASDVQEGDDVVIAYSKDNKNEVNLYCCNHLPDITIEKKTTLVLNMQHEPHKMHTTEQEI